MNPPQNPPSNSFSVKDWRLIVTDKISYHVSKPGLDDNKSHEVISGENGQPIIVLEPKLAFDPPSNLLYENVKKDPIKPDQKIARIICVDGPRFSLGEAERLGLEVTVNEDGSLQIDQDKWWIASLFARDKECFLGYEAICVREKPEGSYTVDILEGIEDVIDKMRKEWEEF